MDSQARLVVSAAGALILVAVAAGCATHRVSDFKGDWRAVNRYADATEAIPLHHAYVFRPSPMDGTLKNMLARWARDASIALDYRHPSDFTLHAPVRGVQAMRIDQAAAQLTSIYAPQRVHVALQDGRLVVTKTDPTGMR